VGAVGANEEVEGDFFLGWGRGRGGVVGEPGEVAAKIGACELVVEVEGYVWELLEFVEEGLVEATAVDGTLELGGLGRSLGWVEERWLTRPWTS
jgi:hypothetical protein